MTSSPRVLVLDPRSPDTLGSLDDLVRCVACSACAAVVLRVESPEQVSALVRVRHAAPTVPILAVTRTCRPGLESLLLEAGADDVTHDEAAAPRQAMELRERCDVGRKPVASCRLLLPDPRGIPDRREALAGADLEAFKPLLVEDDPDAALLMKTAFLRARLPFTLPVLGSGDRAVEWIERAPEALRPSLVLLDIHLPGRSGFEVLGCIRSRREYDRVPVFMLTSSPMEGDIARALAGGAHGYFVKPLSLDALVRLAASIAVSWACFVRAGGESPET